MTNENYKLEEFEKQYKRLFLLKYPNKHKLQESLNWMETHISYQDFNFMSCHHLFLLINREDNFQTFIEVARKYYTTNEDYYALMKHVINSCYDALPETLLKEYKEEI